MKAHIERLRDHAAECAILSAEAETKEKREYFATLNRHLTDLANRAEGVINGTVVPDTFLDRKTQEPFPKEEDEKSRFGGRPLSFRGRPKD
jgi:hypothetical protein